MKARPSCWVGIDTGGTFTDVVLADRTTGGYWFRKVPSNPSDPAEAILRGLDEILTEAGIEGDSVEFVGLGTTLATNAVLEGKTGRVLMLTTSGFSDILELARQRRPHLYNLEIGKPRLSVERQDRIAVSERLDETGAAVTPLDEAALSETLARLPNGFDTFAVCFLHSYRNPAHERRAREIILRRYPKALVCLSSDVNPEFREYERFATTTVNASLLVLMDRYLQRFSDGVKQRGVTKLPYVIQSNGGLISPNTLRQVPVNTFFSGPAGGVVGATNVAQACGASDIVTMDIGGTSTDVCLVRGGRPASANQRDIGGLPVRTASLDLHTIGAGGGSIAWVDAGGLPKVGPESAGAIPGPACYGRGGLRATLTDANMVLGRLNPVALLNGRMPVDAEAARAAIARDVGGSLGVDVERAAAGILQIATTGITGAVRVISVERGEDPRDCALFAFGGGGPLHAAEVAEAMEMRQVIIPPHPGLMSAIGLLAADIRSDFGLTCLTDATPAGWSAVETAFAELDRRAAAWAANEALNYSLLEFHRVLELRYLGQSSELSVSFNGKIDTLDALLSAFHAEHQRRFGYAMTSRGVEVVTARLTARVARPTPHPEPASEVARLSPGSRPVWFAATGFVETPIYQRQAIPFDFHIAGPVVIEQMDTTTIVPPGWNVTADRMKNLMLRREAP
jgi:N-methylhydantoinase A